MSKQTGSDYIPTYADIEHERNEQRARAEAFKQKGFRLGEFELTYTVNGKTFVHMAKARSKIEAIDELKQQCAMVGWTPSGIDVKTLVEPNVYVK